MTNPGQERYHFYRVQIDWIAEATEAKSVRHVAQRQNESSRTKTGMNDSLLLMEMALGM
jgi:hypothetical protein